MLGRLFSVPSESGLLPYYTIIQLHQRYRTSCGNRLFIGIKTTAIPLKSWKLTFLTASLADNIVKIIVSHCHSVVSMVWYLYL